ncbi:Crp/Fnr family transcriptional regulator [Methyloligella halotolerans]|nr:Crp/Fnr family transcriptional regulator [Methyloligella halotolerans]
MTTRPGQSLAATIDGSEAVYFVRSGALIQEVTLEGAHRQITEILHPGGLVRTGSLAEGITSFIAVRAGELLRLRWPVFSELMERNPQICRYFCRTTALQDAAKAIHMAALGQLDTQQRLATYLVELAMRNGVPSRAGGVVFAMPLTRGQMADYLGLNADTLSRIMSGLRARGLIRQQRQKRTVTCQLEALSALTPAAEALAKLFVRGVSLQPLG